VGIVANLNVEGLVCFTRSQHELAADSDVVDLMRSRAREQAVLDNLDEPQAR
jgi:hypothetical protein